MLNSGMVEPAAANADMSATTPEMNPSRSEVARVAGVTDSATVCVTTCLPPAPRDRSVRSLVRHPQVGIQAWTRHPERRCVLLRWARTSGPVWRLHRARGRMGGTVSAPSGRSSSRRWGLVNSTGGTHHHPSGRLSPVWLRVNSDDGLALPTLGRAQGCYGVVERSDVSDVRAEATVPHPLDDLRQLRAVGLDDEVNGQPVGGTGLHWSSDRDQRSAGTNQ